jgi:hypothetical protein
MGESQHGPSPALTDSEGWVADVLDVVTQGKGLAHAVAMAEEAASLVPRSDNERGLNPLDRLAEQADGDALQDLQREGTPSHLGWFAWPENQRPIGAAALKIRAVVSQVQALDNVWARRLTH